MNLSLEGIKGLMRRSVALPDNMSETEIKHYAAEVLKRLRDGENVETIFTADKNQQLSSVSNLAGRSSTSRAGVCIGQQSKLTGRQDSAQHRP